MEQHTAELLSVEGFARRMDISRTTVFEWIKRGQLKPGRHFIKVGRIIRFQWGEELLQKLHDDSVLLNKVEEKPIEIKPAIKVRNRVKNKPSINLDY